MHISRNTDSVCKDTGNIIIVQKVSRLFCCQCSRVRTTKIAHTVVSQENFAELCLQPSKLDMYDRIADSNLQLEHSKSELIVNVSLMDFIFYSVLIGTITAGIATVLFIKLPS